MCVCGSRTWNQAWAVGECRIIATRLPGNPILRFCIASCKVYFISLVFIMYLQTFLKTDFLFFFFLLNIDKCRGDTRGSFSSTLHSYWLYFLKAKCMLCWEWRQKNIKMFITLTQCFRLNFLCPCQILTCAVCFPAWPDRCLEIMHGLVGII